MGGNSSCDLPLFSVYIIEHNSSQKQYNWEEIIHQIYAYFFGLFHSKYFLPKQYNWEEIIHLIYPYLFGVTSLNITPSKQYN